MSEMEPMEIPIDGVLDLHLFNPKELGDLIPDYIEACLEKDITSIRIIHGKGKGVLRRTVHSLLGKNPYVESYGLASDRSGWGATVAELKKV